MLCTWVAPLLLRQKEMTIFDKKIVVSFVLLSSLELPFPDKRYERKENRKGSFALQSVELPYFRKFKLI